MEQKAQNGEVPTISRVALSFFMRVAKGNLRRDFRAVRIAHAERLRAKDAPLLVYMNHASWWDPIICLLLGERYMPQRRHFGPIDAEAYKRYGILRHVGTFPIALGTPRGAAEFLRISLAIFRDNPNVLWLTPQGRFADVRNRPPQLQNGIGALMARKREMTVQPIAVEYVFWDQRKPEVLINIGEPVFLTPSDRKHADELTQIASAALGKTQDELAVLAALRDASVFTTLLEGSRGTGGVYGLWQRAATTLRGERFDPDHKSAPRSW